MASGISLVPSPVASWLVKNLRETHCVYGIARLDCSLGRGFRIDAYYSIRAWVARVSASV